MPPPDGPLFDCAFTRVVSLGPYCEITQAIRRNFGAAAAPERRFEHPTLPFDWMGTPFPALLQLLETDFEGLFERGGVTAAHTHTIDNTRLGCWWQHLIEPRTLPITQAELDARHEEARARIDRQVSRFRSLLSPSGRVLFIRRGEPSPEDVGRLLRALGRLDRQWPFRLLLVSSKPQATELSRCRPMVESVVIPSHEVEPGREESTHAPWDALMARIDIDEEALRLALQDACSGVWNVSRAPWRL